LPPAACPASSSPVSNYDKLTQAFIINLDSLAESFISIPLKYTLNDQQQVTSIPPEYISNRAIDGKVHLSIDLTKFEEIIQGYLTLTLTSKVPELDGKLCFPMKLGVISYSNKEAYQMLKSSLEGTKSSSNAVAGVSMPVVFSQGASVASNPNKVISSFLYLRYLNGPYLLYPNLFFDFIAGMNFMSLFFDNPFATQTYCAECSTPERFMAQNIRTNILYNYGSDMIQFVVYLTLSSLIFGLYFWLIKKHRSLKASSEQQIKSVNNSIDSPAEFNFRKAAKKTSTFPKEMRSDELVMTNASGKLTTRSQSIVTERVVTRMGYVNTHYGYRFIIVELASTSIEYMCYCILNLWTINSALWTLLGGLVSVVYIGGLLTIIVGFFKLYLEISKNCERGKSIGKGKRLSEVYVLTGFRYGVFGVLYDGYRGNLSKWGLLFPAIELTRAILIPAFLILLSNSAIAQVVLIYVVELLYLGFTAYLQVKFSKLEVIFDLLNSASVVIYLTLYLVCFAPISSTIIQHKIGLTMVVLLFGVFALNILFVVLIGVLTLVIAPIKSCMAARGKNKVLTKIKSSTLQDIEVNSAQMMAKENRFGFTPATPARARTVLRKVSNLQEMGSPALNSHSLHKESLRESELQTPKIKKTLVVRPPKKRGTQNRTKTLFGGASSPKHKYPQDSVIKPETSESIAPYTGK